MNDLIQQAARPDKNRHVARRFQNGGRVIGILGVALIGSRHLARHLPAWGNANWVKNGSKFDIASSGIGIAMLFISAAFSVISTRFALKHRQRLMRQKLGQCIHCGYDLRASSGKCPECGNAIL